MDLTISLSQIYRGKSATIIILGLVWQSETYAYRVKRLLVIRLNLDAYTVNPKHYKFYPDQEESIVKVFLVGLCIEASALTKWVTHVLPCSLALLSVD